jgi:O-antigen ligase
MALLADPISVFVGLLLLAATIGIVVGLSRGVGVSEVAAGARPMLFMAAFLTFRFALERDESRGRTLGVLTVASVVVALGQVLQVILGPSVKLFALGTFSDLIELDVATGFLRVRPPGLYLEYVAACMAAACLIWGPKRLRLWAGGSFAILFVGLLVSFNRNMLIGLVVGLTVAAAFSRKRSRFVAVALVATTLVFVAFLYFGGGSTSNPVINRFASLADPSARSIALQDRVYENGLALVSIGKSPIVGIGWGTPYGASAVRNFEGIVAARSRDYVHNQYLASWMRMGILGLVAFVGLMVSTIWGAARAGRRAGSEETAWLGPATVAAMTALAVSSIVDLVILSPSNVPVLAFVAALGSYLWGLANAPSEVEVP